MITVEEFDTLLDTTNSSSTYFICNNGSLPYTGDLNKVWLHPVHGYMIDRTNPAFSDTEGPYILWLKKEIKKFILDSDKALIVCV